MTKSDQTPDHSVRCFLAFPVPPSIRRQLDTDLSRCWKERTGHYRPIPPVNWHMTVYFLGQQSRACLERLYDPIDELLRHQRPGEDIRLTRLGAFPDRRHPRFLVAEGELLPDFAAWQQQLGELLNRHGVQPDRVRWRPHISLARRKGKEPGEPVHEVEIDCRLPIQRLQLMTSTPTPSGSEYHLMREWYW